jgi:hypothetical protein
MCVFNPISRPRIASSIFLVVGIAAVGVFAGPALSATAVGAKAEAATEAVSMGVSGLPQPPRQVEVVVVWGFRLRSVIEKLRIESVKSGYRELIGKSECLTSVCGFVVAPDGNQWRASNVLSGTEDELRDRQRNMEREGTTLVIVHPTGVRRTVPNF